MAAMFANAVIHGTHVYRSLGPLEDGPLYLGKPDQYHSELNKLVKKVRPSVNNFHWISDSRTDPGLVRGHNEDAFIDRSSIGLWAVADGMGGHSAGDVASNAIIERLSGIEDKASLSEFLTSVEAGLLEVNAHLRELGQRPIRRTVGSTVVALILKGDYGVALWAGDSRLYRFRAGALEQVSQDHAFVEDLVERGYLDRKDAADHPQANLVTRAVGAVDDLKLDVEIVELELNDVFILCSDGLDKEVPETDIATIIAKHLRGGLDATLSGELVELALSRGARDNVTVTSVQITANALSSNSTLGSNTDA
jgi:protein phosphatase